MKEKVKENWFLIVISILVISLGITGIYYNIQIYQVSEQIKYEKEKNLFEIYNVNDKVYEFTDGSWFICNNAENEYVFQPVELGDWDYEVKNKEELSKIMATYFINKYNIEEKEAIQEINKILEEVDI